MAETETVDIPNPAPTPGPVDPVPQPKANGWLTRFQEITSGLFRKLMGAGIVFYCLYQFFVMMNGEKTSKDVKVMILTFGFNLVMVVAGFYYGAAHTQSKLEEKK